MLTTAVVSERVTGHKASMARTTDHDARSRAVTRVDRTLSRTATGCQSSWRLGGLGVSFSTVPRSPHRASARRSSVRNASRW
jgi:hypothetical protein